MKGSIDWTVLNNKRTYFFFKNYYFRPGALAGDLVRAKLHSVFATQKVLEKSKTVPSFKSKLTKTKVKGNIKVFEKNKKIK